MRKRIRKLSGVVAILLCGLMVAAYGGSPRAAADTSVTASVCGPEIQPDLAVTAPKSDSTVTTDVVKVTGTAPHANQVLIYIDGLYTSTEAIPVGDSAFQADVSLPEGTHELRVDAVNNYCKVSRAVVLSVNLEGSAAPPDTSVDTDGVKITKPSYNGVIVSSDDMALDESSHDSVGRRLGLWLLTPLDAIRAQEGAQVMNLMSRSVGVMVFLLGATMLSFGHFFVGTQYFHWLHPIRRLLPYIGGLLIILSLFAVS